MGEIGLETTEAGVAVLSISGEHDLNTAPDLRNRLGELIGGGTAVVVDLSPATFVDSSILGTILEARRRAVDAELGFAVVQENGAATVTRVLQITGLREELPVHESRQDALDDAGSDSATEKAST
jgi:anti-sigma B factor antagonist